MDQSYNNISDKDVFEILGISSKEDYFTNLLAETFNLSGNQEFRDRFCNMLSNDSFKIFNSADCRIHTRSVFYIDNIYGNGNRSKVLPDMILISSSQYKVVVIENKIFSDEGYKQTIAYSSPMLRSELNKLLETDGKNEVQVEFYYMTLLGEKANSENFKPLKWTNFIIKTCSNIIFKSPFDILTKDLLSRANELKDFINAPIDLNKSFSDYYNQHKRWIEPKTAYMKYFDPIFTDIYSKYNGKVETFVTKAKGRTPQLLILFSTNDWRRNDLEGYKNGNPIELFENTRNIHLEFTWHVGMADASFMIHYETNPYYSYKKFKQLYPEVEPLYKKHRESFKKDIKQVVTFSRYWKEANTVLALAKTSCKGFMNLPFNDFQKWFFNAFDEAYHMIDKVIESEI
ncbi:hypothetical protein GC105_14895 [Alkalibaculum sp. M08DMB]|uniref:PD-(D/E)XK nuclease superfamily protein n=1 Tax=Alkalibaculum sporogenes TaxID=2655001 RepID=A0A6A7KC26_9FIRM|nr:PD-(D/E)XK nuclease family protein [Alkalibaculum sporogenes]MPW27068.1 hypothetical protein [Alkalibaculum sporogenes]